LVDAPALVLGSTQRDHIVDHAAAMAAGIDVVRRRSGGGAVLVAPGAQVWLDIWLPAGDPLWEDDVVRSSAWLGATWVEALGSLGVDAVAHAGPVDAGEWGQLVCFGGRGPGEVSVAGRKVVGLSQRRTRAGARFQTMALLRWEPDEILALLALEADRRQAARDALAAGAAALPLDGGAVAAAVVAALP
jgi:lipoate-protein ligase A